MSVGYIRSNNLGCTDVALLCFDALSYWEPGDKFTILLVCHLRKVIRCWHQWMMIGEMGLELEGGNIFPCLELGSGLVLGVEDTFDLLLVLDWAGQGWELNRHIFVEDSEWVWTLLGSEYAHLVAKSSSSTKMYFSSVTPQPSVKLVKSAAWSLRAVVN